MYPRQKYNRQNFDELQRKLRNIEEQAKQWADSTDDDISQIGRGLLILLKN